MDRFNITTEDPETSVVINELSGLNLNESQVGLNQFEEKQEDVSSDEGNEDPTGKIGFLSFRVVIKTYNLNHDAVCSSMI